MFVESLVLKDFKLFNDCHIQFSPITVLTGLNSAGKTSILQALLLSRYFAESSATGKVRLRSSDICGVPIGTAGSLIKSGQTEARISITTRQGNFTSILDEEGSISTSTLSGPLHPWRVVPVGSLPASSIQPLTFDSTLQSLFGNSHALHQFATDSYCKLRGTIYDESYFKSAVDMELSRLVGNIGVNVDLVAPFHALLAFRDSQLLPSVGPEQLGAGVTAVLPLVIQACSAKQGETLVVLDPEKHLHPGAQSKVGKLLARLALHGVQVIVETHSEHVVTGVKLGLLSETKLDVNLIGCFFFERGRDADPTFHRVTFDARGRTTDWPVGFFDQSLVDYQEMMKQ